MISFEEVSFSYPGSPRPALEEISTRFTPGQVALVTGPLGAGASTLLLLAAGIAPKVTGGTLVGRVTTLEHEPSSTEGRRALAGRVGLLLPTPWTQLSGMAATVSDEIAFGPANHGWPRERIAECVDRAMERVQVAHLARRDPTTLSGGELQRVLLAALVAMEPQVYLLDEPLLELDPAGADTLRRLLPEIARHATVVVAATDADELVEVTDSVLLLNEGRRIAQGPTLDVLASEAAVTLRCSTTIAEITRSAGVSPRYPLTVSAAVRRLKP